MLVPPVSGAARFVLVPMVFWLNDSDVAISAVCWAGAGLSLLLASTSCPASALFCSTSLYLSLLYAGQTFMTYQWDMFLLETGFVALVVELQPDHRRLARALAVVPFHVHVGRRQADQRRSQLARSLGALLSLSHPAAADAARVVCRTAASRRVESSDRLHVLRRARSAVPHLLPAATAVCRGVRHPLLQSCILLTGNYNWFNLQTMLLCLPLLDDAALRRLLPRRLVALMPARAENQAPRRA